jgi:hypothetical protein
METLHSVHIKAMSYVLHTVNDAGAAGSSTHLPSCSRLLRSHRDTGITSSYARFHDSTGNNTSIEHA